MFIVLKDALYGALVFGLLSFLNEKYKNNEYFSKISGFLVGAPTGYFLALLIFLRYNIISAQNFSYHMLLAVFTTFSIVSLTIILLNNGYRDIVYILNILFLIFILYIYFGFEIYKKF